MEQERLNEEGDRSGKGLRTLKTFENVIWKPTALEASYSIYAYIYKRSLNGVALSHGDNTSLSDMIGYQAENPVQGIVPSF